MQKSIPKIFGQWIGQFKYGPEYEDFYGEIVTFSLMLEDMGDGVFQGKCFELEGVGATSDVAIIKGYIDEDSIHFVKEYSVHHLLEEDGSTSEFKFHAKPILTYDGQYNYRALMYQGHWELENNLGSTIHGDLLSFCTGTWEMSKCE